MEKREIKFRAWDGESMRDEFSVQTDGKILHSGEEVSWVLMQYTGLQDTNGKEIYEGDIVQVGNRNQVVTWLDEGAQFITMNSEDGITNDESGEWDIMTSVEHYGDYVIVGNIYENLDLLKVEGKV